MSGTTNETNKRTLIHTDGGCRGNPGIGGWGVILQIVETDAEGQTSIVKELEMSDAVPHTTNNRMELTAALMGLKRLKNKTRAVTIISDSQYLVKGMSEWMEGWKGRGWRTGDRKPVLNVDLWQELDKLSQAFTEIKWQWVKGHAGHEMNERTDQLANAAMDRLEAQRKAA